MMMMTMMDQSAFRAARVVYGGGWRGVGWAQDEPVAVSQLFIYE